MCCRNLMKLLLSFYLNLVGYKDILMFILWMFTAVFYLNLVGYKAKKHREKARQIIVLSELSGI